MPSWMPLFQELSRTRGTNLINSIFGESIGCFMIHTVDRVQRFRSLTSQKCSEWKKYLSVTVFVAVATLLGLLIAIANLPPAIQTNDLARWTAKKDFWEWCANEEVGGLILLLLCINVAKVLRRLVTIRFPWSANQHWVSLCDRHLRLVSSMTSSRPCHPLFFGTGLPTIQRSY
jgi:hypothetical protein